MKTNFWPSNELGDWLCYKCGVPMGHDYEPPTCCSGHECGCLGMPTEPNICSDKCWQDSLAEPATLTKGD